MPQTPIPTPVGNIFNIQLKNELLAGNVNQTVEMYRAIDGENNCTFVLLPEVEMEISQMVVPQQFIDEGYTVFGLQYLPIYCRPGYQSQDFPDNPKFDSI